MSVSLQQTRNPFCTKCVQQLRYSESKTGELKVAVDMLTQSQYVGKIVGPHGTGKSTLAKAIADQLRDRFPVVRSIVIRKSHLISKTSQEGRIRTPDGASLYIVDGIERLNWMNRRALKSVCRKQGNGLIVTAHRSSPLLWMPTLHETTSSLNQFRALVEQLMVEQETSVPEKQLELAFAHANGNVREAMMQLYDWFEGQR